MVVMITYEKDGRISMTDIDYLLPSNNQLGCCLLGSLEGDPVATNNMIIAPREY